MNALQGKNCLKAYEILVNTTKVLILYGTDISDVYKFS